MQSSILEQDIETESEYDSGRFHIPDLGGEKIAVLEVTAAAISE